MIRILHGPRAPKSPSRWSARSTSSAKPAKRPGGTRPDGATGRRLPGQVIEQARPAWRYLTAALVLDLLATPVVLLTPVPLKIAVDSVVGSNPPPRFLTALLPRLASDSKMTLLLVAAGLQVVVVLLAQLQQLGSDVLHTIVGERLTLEFRSRLFRHLQRLSLAFHDSRGTADSIYRVQYDAQAIQQLTVDGLIPVLASAVALASTIYVTARIDPELALVALAISPLLFVFSRRYKVRMRPRYHAAKKLESSALKIAQETLMALRVVKAFGQEGNEQRRFVGRSSEGAITRIRLAIAEGTFGLLVNLTTALGTAAVLVIGIRNVRSGELSLGELLVVVSYLSQLYGPLKTISKQTASLQSAAAGAERAFELLDELPEVPERPDARPVQRTPGAIEFRQVSFAYDDTDVILRHLSFVIAPGTRLGVVGTTGAGKTTLVSLLLRLYDPTAGQVLLDGVDLRDYQLDGLRNQFGMVLQEAVLFSTSIAENISYGRPGASWDEILAAAVAADAHNFITSFPDGYGTIVGERGMRLSGGERQRISLARAFLKDAPILLLDEPTSSVDVGTESAIFEALERLMEGRTVILITHRPSALQLCDASIQIEHGQITYMAGAISPAFGKAADP